MLSGIMGKVVLIQFAVMACMVGLGYWYYTSSQDTIMQLNKDKAKLETAVQLQEQTIAAQKQAAERQNAAMFELQQSLANAEITRRELETKLRKADLQAMARNNAGDLEAKVNRATTQAFRDIETVTSPKDRPAPPAPPATTVDTSGLKQPLGGNKPDVSSTSTNSTPATKPAATNTSTKSSPQPPPRPPQRSGGS